jgi:hypothetical protein
MLSQSKLSAPCLKAGLPISTVIEEVNVIDCCDVLLKLQTYAYSCIELTGF